MGRTYSHPDFKTKWFPDFVRELPSFEGLTIAITGTTSGLGKVTANAWVSKGGTVRPTQEFIAICPLTEEHASIYIHVNICFWC